MIVNEVWYFGYFLTGLGHFGYFLTVFGHFGYFLTVFGNFGYFLTVFGLPIVTRRGCGEFGELLGITGSSQTSLEFRINNQSHIKSRGIHTACK